MLTHKEHMKRKKAKEKAPRRKPLKKTAMKRLHPRFASSDDEGMLDECYGGDSSSREEDEVIVYNDSDKFNLTRRIVNEITVDLMEQRIKEYRSLITKFKSREKKYLKGNK